MTTWPAGSKATTTSIDQGTDNPNLSRPQIKQDIDNVNAIIDTFDISSSSFNDILSYDSGTGTFVPQQPLSEAIFISDGATTIAGSPPNYLVRYVFEEKFDPNNIVGLSSNSEAFSLAPGKYFIECQSLGGPQSSYEDEFNKPFVYFTQGTGISADTRKYWGFYQQVFTDIELAVLENRSTIVLPGNVSVGSETSADVVVKITKFN